MVLRGRDLCVCVCVCVGGERGVEVGSEAWT